MNSIFNRRAGLTLAALAALGLAGTAAQAQSVFTSWTFDNSAVATNLSPSTAIGTGTASSLGMTNTYGTPGPSTDISDILVSPGTSTSPGTTPGGAGPTTSLDQSWRVRGGAINGGTAANGWSSLAPVDTQGAQFLTSTVGEKNISLSFDWNPTSQGVGDLQLQYTTDGKTFINATVFNAVTGINGLTGSEYYNNLTYTFGAAASNDANFGVRMVSTTDPVATDKTFGTYVNTTGIALNNTSGNWRFDNVNFSGTPAAVPEASTTISFGLLLALGLGGFAVAKKRTVRA
jgi:hypothetical protein